MYPDAEPNVIVYVPMGTFWRVVLMPPPERFADPEIVNVAATRFVVTKIVPVEGGG